MKKFAILFFLMLAALGVFSGCESQESKERLQEVETALESMDASQVYGICDEESKDAVSEDQIKERMSAVYDTLAVESVDYDNLSKNKDASGDGKTVYDADILLKTSSGDIKYTAQLVFTGSDKDMQLAWTPEVVMTGLNDDNTVNVDVTKGKRGTIYARDGEVLAEDNADGTRSYPQGTLTASCVRRLLLRLKMERWMLFQSAQKWAAVALKRRIKIVLLRQAVSL